MQRRTILRRSAAVGALALAGCTGDGNTGAGDPTPGGDGTDDGNPSDGNGAGGETDSPTPAGPPGFEDYAVETTGTGCDEGDGDTATVGFDPDADQVTVDGVLQAATPCHVASFEGVRYGDDNYLEVTVAAKDDESDGACVQCLGAIDYEATVTFTEGIPAGVAVFHGTGEDKTEVVRVARD